MLGINSFNEQYVGTEGLGSILARGSGASGKMIGDSHHLGNSMLPGHAAYALRRDVWLYANGCDKERIPRTATKNPYDARARFNSRECSLGDANYWRASPQSLI